MAIFNKPELNPNPPPRTRKREIPSGLWTKCPSCGEMLFNKELEENLMVCRHCGHHFPMSAPARIQSLFDPDTFQETDAQLRSVDVLSFTGVASYPSRLQAYQERTGLREAVVSGTGQIQGRTISFAVMDFSFLGGSMGSVVGEKITRCIERGLKQNLPVIVVCASGGARMYEGMFSLMQMAKTSGALARLAAARLPFISVLTNPTMAGVMASFASLGDLILAEPRAMIGFAGARVIRETTQQELPKGFQTSEFLLEHGLIDQIVHRKDLRPTLAQALDFLCAGSSLARQRQT